MIRSGLVRRELESGVSLDGLFRRALEHAAGVLEMDGGMCGAWCVGSRDPEVRVLDSLARARAEHA